MRDRRVWIAVGLALLLGVCGTGDTVMLYPGRSGCLRATRRPQRID
ncbi:hypothetical protein [Candidatus Nitrospira bockiana]